MKMREPVNSITHLVGVILSLFGFILLIFSSISTFSIANIISSIIFSFGLVGLYTASTVYHWKIASDEKLEFLRKIDHIMIYILIAATYTPIGLIPLKGAIGYSLLTIVWTLTVIGIILKVFWMNAPRWICTGFYLLLGWISVFFIYPMTKALPPIAITLLVVGGIMYSIGAIIYGKKPEKLKIGKFKFHEIFHIFILLGSFFHFVMIFGYVIV
ncbi:hemolysin III family protein [Alkalibaculum sp. M08DMB]|uniref:Hemolysin III family protein n=1 Tax=Alkalibaculum sporogenes TaxID=2655001 RepID=A0A6A7K6K4_9FIRM|nr:hemolysin III family protein [Alkalibaculum sporogenes]MPW25078.1 hemolysin III family protein [Alkalibaculum sporogenes]